MSTLHSESVVKKEEDGPISYSPEQEKLAVRKLDWTLIPLLGILYLVSFIDRGNIGNAYTAGLGSAWKITSDQYAWIVQIYYIAYICFHWTILLWKVVPLPLWVMIMAIGWGAMSMVQAATTNFAGIMVTRFLIGVFEAGFAPGVALYLSFFYHRREMGLRYGLFISFSPLASCFASAMAFEGAPTILIAFLAYFYLPDGPGHCPTLDARQNEIVGARARVGRGHEEEGKLNFKQVFSAFFDYKNYIQAAIIFSLNTAFGSLPAFLPTIIQAIGFTSIKAQGLSAPPYLLAYITCLGSSFLSDRVGNRGFFITGFCCVGAVGYLLLNAVHTTAIRYFACYLVCAGVFPAVALTFTWVTDNQGSASKRGAGLAIFGMIGQCGPILGAKLFPKSDGPYYSKGMAICAGLLLGAAALAQILSLSMRLQNRKRDKDHGKVDVDSVPDDITDLGDAHPSYRFIL
ncbi:Uncharacterized protein BP5553_07827 [Venustampulla echinocandica]|uniref:Major facilitator superfamily (MFS) profile domain-containing protein n=1 Tax=Venustampulla echinocandica TaxID=2656787 RepID=A0A370THM3_9HELO|nr:Uncharacterized protein BP5553_07827 [Venustampulla echinocandica]RDL34699.1 Uncharacterized protein BP5553_07827 [Venustampulla echinocandica]